MPTLNRARVVAVGSEEDMLRLCRVMLRNSEWIDESEDQPPMTLAETIEQIRARSQVEGGPNCGFCYAMLTQRIYGQADPDTCRMTVRQEPCGLWTATFAYDSDEPFQHEDWLRLHNACGRVPMLALRASWDYAVAKGMLIITGGHVLENWDHMDESWLYLIAQYECGYPPEEAVRRLAKLQDTLEREDSDLTIAELLENCADNLRDIAEHTADPALLAELLAACRRDKDWRELFTLHCRVAETALWETEHNARWLANLEAVRAAWQEYMEE